MAGTVDTIKISRIRGGVRAVQVVDVSPGPAIETSSRGEILLRQIPQYLPEGAKPSREIFEEVLIPLGNAREGSAEVLDEPKADWPGSEVRKIVDQGPDSNRVVLTFVGDGYVESERARFFEDAKRLTRDLFDGKTFASYLPLFNVYAVFVPSKESGLTDVKKVDTALGLYRTPVGSKRAIYPGKPSEIRRALKLAPKTDYPILIANDEYYGGLGGEFAISTRSVKSGMIVLRHELGHNFGNVGEEYDGGYVYSGANSSYSAATTWTQWATDNKIKVNNGVLISGDYVWQDLGKKEYVRKFQMPKDADHVDYTFDTIISSVGWSTPKDVELRLDGEILAYSGEFIDDRSFFTTELKSGLKAGTHEIRATRKATSGQHVLAFLDAYAYPPGYDFDSSHIGAYATYSEGGNFAGYRPTHSGCLMRDMSVEHFCSVDRENMWFKLLGRMSLIDSLKYENGRVRVKAPNLPGLEVRWEINGQERPALQNQLEWIAAQELTPSQSARVKVILEFRSPEVRKSSSVLKAEKIIDI